MLGADDADYTFSVLELLLLLLPNNLPQSNRNSTKNPQQKKDSTEKRPKTADCIGMVIQKFPVIDLKKKDFFFLNNSSFFIIGWLRHQDCY